jgi:AcrR family transcriptional regulator
MNRGRPRTFDKTEALEQATQLFWRNGYRGVSLDELTQTLGINKPSLYSAFGDKEELFLQVVDHYRDTVIVPIYVDLMKAPALADGLRKFFQSLGKAVTNKERPGCLSACMMTQECAESPEIKAKLAEVIASADAAFEKLLQQHQKELRPGVTPRNAASFLTSLIHGMAVRARSGGTTKDLQPIAEFAIASVCSK